jgi:hypothetical protein
VGDSTKGRPLAAAPIPGAVSTPVVDRWAALAAVLRDPNFELDCEGWAGLWLAFTAERRRGRQFDPTLVALMQCLSRQVMTADARGVL